MPAENTPLSQDSRGPLCGAGPFLHPGLTEACGPASAAPGVYEHPAVAPGVVLGVCERLAVFSQTLSSWQSLRSAFLCGCVTLTLALLIYTKSGITAFILVVAVRAMIIIKKDYEKTLVCRLLTETLFSPPVGPCWGCLGGGSELSASVFCSGPLDIAEYLHRSVCRCLETGAPGTEI